MLERIREISNLLEQLHLESMNGFLNNLTDLGVRKKHKKTADKINKIKIATDKLIEFLEE